VKSEKNWRKELEKRIGEKNWRKEFIFLGADFLILNRVSNL
jgi:hypothetical protein